MERKGKERKEKKEIECEKCKSYCGVVSQHLDEAERARGYARCTCGQCEVWRFEYSCCLSNQTVKNMLYGIFAMKTTLKVQFVTIHQECSRERTERG